MRANKRQKERQEAIKSEEKEEQERVRGRIRGASSRIVGRFTSGVCTTLPRLHMSEPYTLSRAWASIVSALFSSTLCVCVCVCVCG